MTGTSPVVVAFIELPANAAFAGTSVVFSAIDTISSAANPPIYRIHIGTSASPSATAGAGNAICQIGAGTGKLPSASTAYVTHGMTTVTSTGASAAHSGGGHQVNDANNAAVPAGGGTNSGSFNSAVHNYVVLTCANTSSITRTVKSASLHVVQN